jgi:hypothetical protein
MGLTSFKFEIPAKSLGDFLDGICKTNSRKNVRNVLKSAGLSWDSYWDIIPATRKSFVEAMLWAELTPTLTQVRKIFVEEKLQGPVNTILIPQKWWYPSGRMNPILEKFYRGLSLDELTRLGKRDNYQLPIVVFTDEKNLPLLMTMDNFRSYMREIELRLKGKKISYSIITGGLVIKEY